MGNKLAQIAQRARRIFNSTANAEAKLLAELIEDLADECERIDKDVQTAYQTAVRAGKR